MPHRAAYFADGVEQGIEAATVRAVVPHWCAPEWCQATVESLRSQEDVSLDLVVVDNSPTAELAMPPGVELRRSGANLGFAGAVNEILSEWLADHRDGHEFLLVACHDCVLPSNKVLASLVAALRREPDLGVVGPTTRQHHDLAVEPRVYVSGTCMMIKRGCALDVGLFDEDLGTYDEDLDFCLRVWDEGWRVGVAPTGEPLTQGSAADDRIKRISRNHILLAFKRRALAGALVELALQLRRSGIAMIRSFVGAPERRGSLRREAVQRAAGAVAGFCKVVRRGSVA